MPPDKQQITYNWVQNYYNLKNKTHKLSDYYKENASFNEFTTPKVF